MKKRLMIGAGLLVVVVVASLIAFTTSPDAKMSSQQSVLESVDDAPFLIDSVAQEISAPTTETQLESVLPVFESIAETIAVSSTDDQADGTNEGIKVHGHWTIDVHEPQGKLVSHSEFDNYLTTFGATSLVQFLTRNRSVGSWKITTSGSPPPCTSSIGGLANCELSELPASFPLIQNEPGSEFPELSVTENSAGNLELAGSITIGTDTDLGTVITYVARCSSTNPATDASTSPSYRCPAGEIGIYQAFTYKDLVPQIAVLTGQVVNITVVISFS